MPSTKSDRLAGIQYVGLAGISAACQDAVLRLVQYGDRITRVCILSSPRDYHRTHCLLLTAEFDELIAVKSGFASGYGGEGPDALSYVLNVLREHGAEIEEYDVSAELIECIDSSALLQSDLDSLRSTRPVHPSRWYDYIAEAHWDARQVGRLWGRVRPVVPFAVVDSRLTDLAITFWDSPDQNLLTAYCRLEDTVRKRTGTKDHGSKLFSNAFLGASAKLDWEGLDSGEREGRGNLSAAAYMAHRNPRAHREVADNPDAQLTEFLLVNHLFRLEREAVERPSEATEAGGKKGGNKASTKV